MSKNSKRSSKRTKADGSLYDSDRKKANEKFKALAPDFSKDEPQLDANIQGLEKLGEKITETQKKILNIILTDFSPENSTEAEKDIFKKLRAACARAGMLGKSGEVDFFRTLADPGFNNIVKTVGQGIIGMYIVPVAAKVVQQALEGDKTSQKWVLEIAGLLQTKYDFYLQRYQMKHQTINVGEINFSDKSDEELEELVSNLEYVPEAEVVVSEA